MATTCNNCGYKYAENGYNCPACGKKVDDGSNAIIAFAIIVAIILLAGMVGGPAYLAYRAYKTKENPKRNWFLAGSFFGSILVIYLSTLFATSRDWSWLSDILKYPNIIITLACLILFVIRLKESEYKFSTLFVKQDETSTTAALHSELDINDKAGQVAETIHTDTSNADNSFNVIKTLKGIWEAIIKMLFKYKKAIAGVVCIVVIIILSFYGYKFITTHEPNDAEKQQVISHFERLSAVKWVATTGNINYSLEFSPAIIRRTESKDGGMIVFEVAAKFMDLNFVDVRSIKVVELAKLENNLTLLYRNYNNDITHKLFIQNLDGDSLVGHIQVFGRDDYLRMEQDIKFIAYPESIFLKKQDEKTKELINRAIFDKTILEGKYYNLTNDQGSQNTDFVEFKINSDTILRMQSGSTGGDLNANPPFVVRELKLLNNRIYVLGTYESMPAHTDTTEAGYFSYSISANAFQFKDQKGNDYSKKEN